jgi:hypothetical protein
MTVKIVINKCYGGFGLSNDVIRELELNDEWPDNSSFDIESDNYEAWRADPRLISAIEKIGVIGSSGWYTKLKIVEIPDGVDWRISEYDGMEHVYETHRTWS